MKMDRTVPPASSTDRSADVSQPISVEAIRMQLEKILASQGFCPLRPDIAFYSDGFGVRSPKSSPYRVSTRVVSSSVRALNSFSRARFDRWPSP